MDLHSAREAIVAAEGMDAATTRAVIEMLFAAELPVAQGAELLLAWQQRNETAIEIATLVEILLQRAVRVPVQLPCLDLCGTGGSGLTRFNISTTAAFILAAAGVPVAKHGNLGSRRPNGSFDLLQELEVPFQLPPEALAELQADTGVCFLFARAHHPAVKAVAPYRQASGRRSIFNLAGPLANPATLRSQLIGVSEARLGPILAESLQRLGQPGLVVHGEPGIDELSPVGRNHYWRVEGADAPVVGGTCDEILHAELSYAQLPGGDAPVNAELFRQLVHGGEKGPLADMLCLNAGAAIDLWHGRPPCLRGPGFTQAQELLASGAVADTFEGHRRRAAELAPR